MIIFHLVFLEYELIYFNRYFLFNLLIEFFLNIHNYTFILIIGFFLILF